jgi:hypothetical protein
MRRRRSGSACFFASRNSANAGALVGDSLWRRGGGGEAKGDALKRRACRNADAKAGGGGPGGGATLLPARRS